MGCYFLWGVEMIVYLDVDGVLANFNKAACKALGVSYPPLKWHWYKDVLDGFNKLNEICTFDFWENLEWMPDGTKIFEEITNQFPFSKILLITAPMPNKESATGKWKWIDKQLPGFSNQTIITQVSKSLLAKPNTLLIDDKTQNVDEFRQAGGQTILVPRPWNSLHLLADKSVEIVKQQLAEVKCHEFL